jgi:outer membrane protein assembly factor BamB
VWKQPYDTVPADTNNEEYVNGVRSGQVERGSGTTPTVLGEGKYVAITDNAEQMKVVVYRTDARLGPKEERVVCEVPAFEFPEAGKGANSNSLVGSRNSIIVQNTTDYLWDWAEYDDAHLEHPGKPGIARIDIDPNGRGCTKVWVNKEVRTTMARSLSTRTGLIYNQDRKYDDKNKVNAYYFVALNFRTGEVVWEKLAGTFARTGPATFDNIWPAMGFGPNGALYGTNIGGVTILRDGE